MAYLALYRAFRPQRFAEVIGQEHITRTLTNSLEQRRFSHAYLFSGPRGSGKTSVAKIFAKAINCESSVGGEPCNECASCLAITKGSLLDVIEIDAASNRGVDEIRELRENVKFTPTEVKYKVYIIDEVHMLTTEAFNALLKTLEEPPAHVAFILATTEPHKLPLTIISRCQRFDFKRIPAQLMADRLREIAETEGYQISPEALALVARFSEGAMRDALGLLDQAFAMADVGEEITADDILTLTGRPLTEEFAAITNLIVDGETEQVLDQISQLLYQGKEPQRILEDLIFYYRDLLLLKTAPKLAEVESRQLIDKGFKAAADRYHDEEIYQAIELLNKYLSEMRFTTQSRILLELALVRLSRMMRKGGALGTPIEPVKTAEPAKVAAPVKAVKAVKPAAVAEVANPVEVDVSNNVEAAQPPEPEDEKPQQAKPTRNGNGQIPDGMDLGTYERLCKLCDSGEEELFERVKHEWPEVLIKVKNQKINVHAWLIDGEPVCAADNRIVLAFKSVMHRDTTSKQENLKLIERVVKDHLGREFQLVNVMLKDWQQIEEPKPVANQAADKSTDELVADTISLFGEDLVEIIE